MYKIIRINLSKTLSLFHNTSRSYTKPSKTMAPKRKATSSNALAATHHTDQAGDKPNARSAEAAQKKQKTLSPSHPKDAKEFPDRRFYGKEISAARCQAYNEGRIPRPIEVLEKAIEKTRKERDAITPGKAVVHWFKRDLRIFDNRGLSRAADVAKKAGIPLICLYIISPEDWDAHLASCARVDFDLRTMAIVQRDLDELDIPVVFETVGKRGDVRKFILDFCQENGVKHVFTNIEYEVDELRREAGLVKSCLEKGIAFTPIHDDVVVPPGQLSTGQGKQYAVYSPWFRSWIKHVHSNPDLLEASPKPGKNPASARKDFKSLFNCEIPSAPDFLSLSNEDATRLRSLWPAGEHEAQARLKKFTSAKLTGYADKRNIPPAPLP